MKIALIGATGQAGSPILKELVRRGHQVTAIVRNPEKVQAQTNVTAKKGDVFDKDGLAALLKGHDVVISSVHFSASDPHKLIDAVKASGAKRYLVVGGAGSLEVAPGVTLVSTPEFPAAYKDEATKGGEFLNLLRQGKELDWTFLSPSALFFDGPRTGTFPSRQGSASDHGGGQQHLVRGLRHRTRRRDREAVAFKAAVHGGVLVIASTNCGMLPSPLPFTGRGRERSERVRGKQHTRRMRRSP